MADIHSTGSEPGHSNDEPNCAENLDKAVLVLDYALGTVDMIYTLHTNNQLDSLCAETLGAALSGLLAQVAEVRELVISSR